jgi:hypothetical protein
MKLKPLVEKLEQSDVYKDFRIKYPDSFMVAGFFVLDLEEGANIHQIDFYVPSEKKIAAFTMDGEITVKLLEILDPKKAPKKLDLNTKIDLDAIQGILTDEMRNRGMSEDIRKIIAVIQNVDGKRIWNLNCVLSGMEILKSHVEDESKTVLKIEKTSVLEIMKKMPAPKLLKAPVDEEGTEEDLTDELGKLDKIEQEIEKAKTKLKEELQKKSSKKKPVK